MFFDVVNEYINEIDGEGGDRIFLRSIYSHARKNLVACGYVQEGPYDNCGIIGYYLSWKTPGR